MADLHICGGRRLEGELMIQGSKNSALPVMAASLLTDEITVIENCPDIADVREMADILTDIGCEYSFQNGCMVIYPVSIEGVPDACRCGRLRASSILMGALLSTAGYFVLPYPGGCNIGRRPLDYHIRGLISAGAVIEERDGMILGYCGKLKGCRYVFPYPSVGALENMIMASVRAHGVTVLENCSKEPEISDLCSFLCSMGADIKGAGTEKIVIDGVKRLRGVRYRVPGDRIAAGTYMTCCAAAGGNVKISGIEPSRLGSVSEVLKTAGCSIFTYDGKNEIITMCDRRCMPVGTVTTGPFPGFPTDMQPQIMSVASCASGISVIEDRVFENRYHAASELNSMGADIRIDGGRAVVYGREQLHGGTVVASDLRCGAALAVAALAAYGETTIKQCGHINRGYENIQRDLAVLGADVEWRQEGIKKQ